MVLLLAGEVPFGKVLLVKCAVLEKSCAVDVRTGRVFKGSVLLSIAKYAVHRSSAWLPLRSLGICGFLYPFNQ